MITNYEIFENRSSNEYSLEDLLSTSVENGYEYISVGMKLDTTQIENLIKSAIEKQKDIHFYILLLFNTNVGLHHFINTKVYDNIVRYLKTQVSWFSKGFIGGGKPIFKNENIILNTGGLNVDKGYYEKLIKKWCLHKTDYSDYYDDIFYLSVLISSTPILDMLKRKHDYNFNKKIENLNGEMIYCIELVFLQKVEYSGHFYLSFLLLNNEYDINISIDDNYIIKKLITKYFKAENEKVYLNISGILVYCLENKRNVFEFKLTDSVVEHFFETIKDVKPKPATIHTLLTRIVSALNNDISHKCIKKIYDYHNRVDDELYFFNDTYAKDINNLIKYMSDSLLKRAIKKFKHIIEKDRILIDTYNHLFYNTLINMVEKADFDIDFSTDDKRSKIIFKTIEGLVVCLDNEEIIIHIEDFLKQDYAEHIIDEKIKRLCGDYDFDDIDAEAESSLSEFL